MAALPAWEDTLLPSAKGNVLELDELWSFVQSKAQEVWLWSALCRCTRQVVAYTSGDRSEQGARSLRVHTSRRVIAVVPPAVTSGWPTRLPFHHAPIVSCGKEEGETNHAERFFGTIRARLSQMVRRSYAFSKRVERHLEAIYLFLTNYNLRIKQTTIA